MKESTFNHVIKFTSYFLVGIFMINNIFSPWFNFRGIKIHTNIILNVSIIILKHKSKKIEEGSWSITILFIKCMTIVIQFVKFIRQLLITYSDQERNNHKSWWWAITCISCRNWSCLLQQLINVATTYILHAISWSDGQN